MSYKREKRQRVTSPRGIAQYPSLTTPDTKFDEAGVYKVNLIVPTVLAEKICSQIDAAVAQVEKEWKADPKNKGKRLKFADLPYNLNPDNEDETILKFKCKASFIGRDGTKVNIQPAIFDAAGKPAKGLRIGGGSTLRVSAELNPFYVPAIGAGCGLRLKAVQVIELVEYGGGGNASAYGFEAEDGFSAEDAEDGFPEEREPGEDDGDDTPALDSDGSDF